MGGGGFVDFDDDDDVFDEDAEDEHVARLSEFTINANTGERVACPLEKGASTGEFLFLPYYF